MAETPKLELIDIQPIILKLEGRVQTKSRSSDFRSDDYAFLSRCRVVPIRPLVTGFLSLIWDAAVPLCSSASSNQALAILNNSAFSSSQVASFAEAKAFSPKQRYCSALLIIAIAAETFRKNSQGLAGLGGCQVGSRSNFV